MASGASYFFTESNRFARLIRAAVDRRDRERHRGFDWRETALRMLGREYRRRIYSARLGRWSSRYYKNTHGVI